MADDEAPRDLQVQITELHNSVKALTEAVGRIEKATTAGGCFECGGCGPCFECGGCSICRVCIVCRVCLACICRVCRPPCAECSGCGPCACAQAGTIAE